jgi:hypothetical protein
MRMTRSLGIAVVAVLSACFVAVSPPVRAGDVQWARRPLPESCVIWFGANRSGQGGALRLWQHDEKNYLELRLRAKENAVGKRGLPPADFELCETVDGRTRELGAVSGVGREALAQTGAVLPPPSGALFLRPGGALLYGRSGTAAATLTLKPAKRWGLALTGGKPAFTRLRVQPDEPVRFSDDFMREKGTGDQWEPVSGTWAVRTESDPTRSANAFRCIATAKGVGLMTAGDVNWHEYTMAASVCARAGSVGLVFGRIGAGDYWLFRIGVRSGKAELVRVTPDAYGRPTSEVISAAAKALHPGAWHRLSVGNDANGFACFVDGRPAVRLPRLSASGGDSRPVDRAWTLHPVGKVGLWVHDANRTLWDDVLVRATYLPLEPLKPIELFSQVFESDSQMENWASLWSAWRPDRIGARGQPTRRVYWHKGDFYGRTRITVRPKLPKKAKWETGLIAGGNRQDLEHGTVLRVSSEGTKASWSLADDGKQIPDSGRVTLRSGDTISLDYHRDGRMDILIGEASRRFGISLAEMADGPHPTRCRVGLWFRGADVNLHKVEIRNRNVHDYLFETAPTEWLARTGTWQVTNRWQCDPRWSWLGGGSDQVAQFWSKRAFYGDQTIEFFAALRMQELGGNRYPHIGDLNLTFCGDGRNLDSGYQIIYAGWGNRWTRLLREGKAVAGSGNAIIRGNFHRRWFHIKVRKRGDYIELYVDDELVRRYRDPKPVGRLLRVSPPGERWPGDRHVEESKGRRQLDLRGGRIALWTVDNQIMIARVRVYAEHSEPVADLVDTTPAKEPPPQEEPPLPDGCFTRTTFANGTGGLGTRDGKQGAALRRTKDGLLVTNPNAGGSFGVTLCDRTFNVQRHPIVRLRWQVVSEEPVRLNLFARVNGRLLELPLTAPPALDVATTLHGSPEIAFHGTPNEAVRTAEIDLGRAVETLVRARKPLPPEHYDCTELYLANASNKDYLLCGIGGNRAGARLLLREFAIRARER